MQICHTHYKQDGKIQRKYGRSGNVRVKATIIIKEVRQIVKYMPEKRAGIKPTDVLRADKKMVFLLGLPWDTIIPHYTTDKTLKK